MNVIASPSLSNCVCAYAICPCVRLLVCLSLCEMNSFIIENFFSSFEFVPFFYYDCCCYRCWFCAAVAADSADVVVVQKLLCWISNASAAATYDCDVECASVNVPYGC